MRKSQQEPFYQHQCFASASVGKIEQLLWSVLPSRLFSKTSIIPISMSSDQKDGSTTKLFLQLNNQTSLHRLLYWKMRWRHKDFQGVWWWPIIKLVTLIHCHSHLILLEIAVGCCRFLKIRSFEETKVNLNWLLEKLDIIYTSQNS